MDGVVGTAVGSDGAGEAVLKVYLTSFGAAVLPRSVAGVPVQLEVTGRFVALEDAPTIRDAEAVDPTAGFPRGPCILPRTRCSRCSTASAR